MARCPYLEHIVYDEPRGLRHYTQPFLPPFVALLTDGRDYNRTNSDFYDAQVARGGGGAQAVILYTTGTTGTPTGDPARFDQVNRTTANGVKWEGSTEDEKHKERM